MSPPPLEQAIPAGETLLLDSTAIVSYFKGSEPVSPVAAQIIDGFVLRGRNEAMVSTVTAMEILVDPIRRDDHDLLHEVTTFLLHTEHVTLADVRYGVALEAAHLRAELGLKPPDALIVASAIRYAARYLVCNDQEWKRKLPRKETGITVVLLADYAPPPSASQ